MSGPKGGGYAVSAEVRRQQEELRRSRLLSEIASVTMRLDDLRIRADKARADGLDTAPRIAVPAVAGVETSGELMGILAHAQATLRAGEEALGSARHRARVAEVSSALLAGAADSASTVAGELAAAAQAALDQAERDRAARDQAAQARRDAAEAAADAGPTLEQTMAELAAITQRGEAQRAAAESDRAALLQASADRVARAGERSADRVAALRERAALIMSTLPEGVPDATVDSLLDMTRQIAQASDPQALGSVVGRLATAADAAASTARRRAFVQGEAAAVLAMLAGLESPDANDLRARAEAALESGQDWNPELRGQARAEAARLDAVAERLQVASALAESLIALGYEVGPGFERVLAGKGGAYAYRGRWSEHALRVRVDGDAGRVAMEVVRRVGDETAVSAAGTSADVLRDEEVETEFCATLEPVLSMAAGLGIDVEIDRRSDPGHKPVRRVTDAVPAEATRMRRRAEEADKEMRVDE